MTAWLRFDVADMEPVEQGSKVAGVTKDGKPYLYDAASLKHRLVPWRTAVTNAARVALGRQPQIRGAVKLTVNFTTVRPKTVTRPYPSVRPDIDKLLRALMDGITASGAWEDDARVTDVVMNERYGEVPGVSVLLVALEPQGE